MASRAFSLLSTGRAASRDAGGGFSPPPRLDVTQFRSYLTEADPRWCSPLSRGRLEHAGRPGNGNTSRYVYRERTEVERGTRSRSSGSTTTAGPHGSIPTKEREREPRASERASDRPLLLRRPLSCFNCGIEHVQRQLANTTYLPLRPASAFQRVPVPFRLAELPQPRARALERGRAQRADRMSLRFAFFDLLPCRHDPARLVSEPRGLLTLHIPRARHPRRHRSSIDRGVSNRSKPTRFRFFSRSKRSRR